MYKAVKRDNNVTIYSRANPKEYFSINEKGISMGVSENPINVTQMHTNLSEEEFEMYKNDFPGLLNLIYQKGENL